MKLKEITDVIERFAPLRWQESYDNSGLIVGRPDDEVHKALLAVDVTEEVLDEAEREGCDLIVTHHPIIFHALKRFNSADSVQRCVERAIRRGIALYACHTNLDSAPGGMSWRLAGMLGIGRLEVLQPAAAADAVQPADGSGTGRTDCSSGTTVAAGAVQAETPVPVTTQPGADGASAESSASDTSYSGDTPEEAHSPSAANGAAKGCAAAQPPAGTGAVGFGVVGELPAPEETMAFLQRLQRLLGVEVVRHSAIATPEVRRVALCTGAGASLIGDARRAGAELYVTADLKYNDFMTPDKALTVADIGHFESEYCAIQLLHDILSKNLCTFAVRKSEYSLNPVKYLVSSKL